MLMTLLNDDDQVLLDKLDLALKHIKKTFIGKDDIIDLMGICLAGRENLFMLGPPGTAKSAMVRELSRVVKGKTFEYLLTRFTEPNELFGPFDIRKLREGDLITNTDGMLPEADLVFLDELLNANSAILNSLLMVLNERVFRRGREHRSIPALLIVGASNQLPEDDALRALFDRFLIRVKCDYIDPALLPEVLHAGWALDRSQSEGLPSVSRDDILKIQALVRDVDVGAIRSPYIELISKLRNAGVDLSDRRAVKLQRLIAASAVLCRRMVAIPSDLWVLRFIWETDEQREVIAGIVNAALEQHVQEPGGHPRAIENGIPDADQILKEVNGLAEKWSLPTLPLAERSVIKDRLRFLNGQSQWISNTVQREFVQKPIEDLWNKILENN